MVRWYREQMKVLSAFRERYSREKPFRGRRILICMHCEPKAAVRTEVMLEGGAEEIIFIGNPGSTKDDVAAYLDSFENVTVMAKSGDTSEDIRRYARIAMEEGPYDLFMDNGAALMLAYSQISPEWKPMGGIEETRSGRLLLDQNNIIPAFPHLVIDDSPVKRLIENEAGVGQSVVDGFMRQTSMLIGGKRILIIGYGWCGTGISQRFRALGAVTMVYDKDPVRLLKAKIEGHKVAPLEELLPQADVIITVTGRFKVVGASEISLMKDGAILANAGHYGEEIDRQALIQETGTEVISSGCTCYRQMDGRRIYLLQNAHPLNLSAGSGNPIEIMELGYALQLLSLEAILSGSCADGLQALPDDVNDKACHALLGF